MNTWARKSFKVGVLAAGGLLFAGTAANAATINSIGNSGLLTGNQANATVQAPIDVCGNGVGVLGFGAGSCQGGSWASIGDDNTTLNSIGNSGALTGNQLNATVQAPIDVCGNGVGVAGAGLAGCQGGSWATIGGGNGGGSNGGGYYSTNTAAKSHAKSHAKKSTSHVTESTTLTSVGNNGAGVGNQANAVVQIPIDVCGNAVGVLGAAQASCQGGASATDNGSESTNLTSGFNAGFLTGNQANALVQIPINVCGNAVGVLGAAQASCQGGSSATIGNGGGGNGGGGNGGGNGGYGYGGGMPGGVNESSMAKPAKVHHNMGGGNACSPTLNSFGNSGLLTGNQLNAVVQAPIDISGNAVGVLGAAFASSQGGAWASC
jgi:hypothetical protein